MISIGKLNSSSLGISYIQAGIQFAYGRLWSFVEGCTTYTCDLFSAVFIGTEGPTVQPIRRQVHWVRPAEPEVNPDSDDNIHIPDEPLPSERLNLPRTAPIGITIRPGSPIEEKLQEIEAKMTTLLEK